MEDMREFMEAIDEEADFPTAGTEAERLEAELDAGLKAMSNARIAMILVRHSSTMVIPRPRR